MNTSDQKYFFNNKKISGVNVLYVVRDPDANADGSKLPWAVTRKAYVDNHAKICYNDKEIDMNGCKITNIGYPVNDKDAVCKSYIDKNVKTAISTRPYVLKYLFEGIFASPHVFTGISGQNNNATQVSIKINGPASSTFINL